MATAVETRIYTRHKLRRFTRLIPAVVVALFSCFYFADVILRAREKYLWYDELITWYLCRLPTFHDTWVGVLRGFDFNPPLFYLITRWSERAFGDGNIGMRVPEMIGFWALSVCLFIFVRRRAGILAGYIAMLFPMLTGAFYYAYEARPHGIVLGFCGLALVCWQMASEHTSRRPLWLAAFGLSIFGACMVHCYAVLLVVPFALAEAVRVVRLRRIEWSSWLSMAIPDAIAAMTYFPLLAAYRQKAKAVDFLPSKFPPSWSDATNFYVHLLDPCILILVAAFVLFALDQSGRFSPATVSGYERPALSSRLHDLAIAVGLLALPFIGVLLAMSVKGPFFERYFMSAAGGLAIIFGLAAAWRRRYGWVAITLALIMTLFVGKRFAGVVWHTHKGIGEYLQEPSSGLLLETTPGKPLASYALLELASNKSEPIIIANELEFFRLVFYGGSLTPRLYRINEFHNPTFNSFRAYCHIDCNPDYTLDEFLKSHRRFYVFGEGYTTLAPRLIRKGARIVSLILEKGHSLAEFAMP
jgi:hypothetical protein